MIADAVGIPVIASGGAGKPEHLYEVLTAGHADAALVASMVHFGEYTVTQLEEISARPRRESPAASRRHEPRAALGILRGRGLHPVIVVASFSHGAVTIGVRFGGTALQVTV